MIKLHHKQWRPLRRHLQRGWVISYRGGDIYIVTIPKVVSNMNELRPFDSSNIVIKDNGQIWIGMSNMIGCDYIDDSQKEQFKAMIAEIFYATLTKVVLEVNSQVARDILNAYTENTAISVVEG